MRYGCYANGFWFDFHLADFTFFQTYVLPQHATLLVINLTVAGGHMRYAHSP